MSTRTSRETDELIVRQIALHQAVEMSAGRTTSHDQVVEAAKAFEKFLRGEK